MNAPRPMLPLTRAHTSDSRTFGPQFFELAPPCPVGLLNRPIDILQPNLPHEVQIGQRRVRNGQRVGRDHSPHSACRSHALHANRCTTHDRRGHWRYGGWPPVPRQKHFRERFRLGATPMQRCSASGLLQWVKSAVLAVDRPLPFSIH